MSYPGSVPLPLFSPTSCAGCRRHQRGADRAAEALFQCKFTLIVRQRCHWMGLHEAAEAPCPPDLWPRPRFPALIEQLQLSALRLPTLLFEHLQTKRAHQMPACRYKGLHVLHTLTYPRVVTDTHKYFIVAFHSPAMSYACLRCSKWTCKSGKYDSIV